MGRLPRPGRHEQSHRRGRPRDDRHHILATGRPYCELGADYFARRLDPERETRHLIARLEARVTLEDAAA